MKLPSLQAIAALLLALAAAAPAAGQSLPSIPEPDPATAPSGDFPGRLGTFYQFTAATDLIFFHF